MNKQIITLVILLLSFSGSYCQGIIKLKDSKKTFKTDRNPQLIYVGLGGPAIGLSINYDRRFKKRVDGLGYNGGIGFRIGRNNLSYTSIPLGVNYLLGNANNAKYLEVGLSQTILFMGNTNSANYITTYILGDTKLYAGKAYTFTNLIIGYRNQPNEGGFNFRIGLNPVLFEGATDMGAYISIGYNF